MLQFEIQALNDYCDLFLSALGKVTDSHSQKTVSQTGLAQDILRASIMDSVESLRKVCIDYRRENPPQLGLIKATSKMSLDNEAPKSGKKSN